MKNQRTNKKLQNQLVRQCKKCTLKEEMGKCPYSNKYECTLCNVIVAETVLKDYSECDLMSIPVSYFIRGLQAHKYSGELQKTRVIQI